jgi:hypothetical protein
MQNKIRRFTVNQLVILFLLFHVSIGYSATYFVSNEGSDSNNGKKESPFKSISFAITKLSENDTLYFREGKYYTSKKINLKSNIYLLAFNNEKVEIHGTELKTIWINIGNNRWKTNQTDSVIQLFIDGFPYFQAAYPNIPESIFAIKKGAYAIANPSKEVYIQSLSKFNPMIGARILGIHGKGLVALNGNIKSQAGDQITIENDAFYWNEAFRKDYLDTGTAFVYGSIQFLDNESEWYWENKELYFYSKTDPNLRNIETRDQNMIIDASNLTNINIEGITFFGFNLSFKNCIKSSIKKCKILYPVPFFNFKQGFEKFSPNGINGYEDPENWNGNGPDWNKYDGPETWHGNSIEISGENNTIENCYIAHSWGDGLTVWGKSNKILNNIITDCNWIGIDCAALNVSGSNHLIQNNELSYTGRSVLLHRFLEKSKIINNHIHHGGILNNDQGLTYSFWTDGKGTEIAYNYLHDNLGSTSHAGIYLDNWTYNFNIHHNIINNAGTGININKPHNNHLLYNNTLYNNTYSMGAWGPEGTTIRNVKTFNNLTNTNKKAKWNYDAFYGTSMDSNYIFFDNNIFVDPLNHNFQLRKNSYPIDRGIKNEFTTDYKGSSPDIGALESGVPPWKYGSTLIIPNEKYYPPKAPLQLELLANTFDTTLLRWNYPFQLIDSFYIERKSAIEMNYSIIARIAASDTTYNDANQPPGEYRYQVRAKNTYGISDPSNSIQVFNPVTNNSLYFDAEESDLQEGTNAMVDLLINTDNKDWICFKGIDLANTMYDACMVNMAVPCESAWQEIQVRLDHPMGRMIGKFRPPSTGGWDKYKMYSFPIEEIKGNHDIYFRFKGEYGIGTMDWFTFYDSNGEIKEYIPYDSLCPFPSLKNREIKMKMFPNPGYSEINLTFDCQEKSTLEVEVFDTRGVIFYTNKFENLTPGTVEIHLHDDPKVNALLPGVYMVKTHITSKKVDSYSMMKFIKTNE